MSGLRHRYGDLIPMNQKVVGYICHGRLPGPGMR